MLDALLDALLDADFLLMASTKSASCCALSCSLLTIAYATAAPAAAPRIVPMMALPVIWNPDSELEVETVGFDGFLVTLGAFDRLVVSTTLDGDML